MPRGTHYYLLLGTVKYKLTSIHIQVQIQHRIFSFIKKNKHLTKQGSKLLLNEMIKSYMYIVHFKLIKNKHCN